MRSLNFTRYGIPSAAWADARASRCAIQWMFTNFWLSPLSCAATYQQKLLYVSMHTEDIYTGKKTVLNKHVQSTVGPNPLYMVLNGLSKCGINTAVLLCR